MTIKYYDIQSDLIAGYASILCSTESNIYDLLNRYRWVEIYGGNCGFGGTIVSIQHATEAESKGADIEAAKMFRLEFSSKKTLL